MLFNQVRPNEREKRGRSERDRCCKPEEWGKKRRRFFIRRQKSHGRRATPVIRPAKKRLVSRSPAAAGKTALDPANAEWAVGHGNATAAYTTRLSIQSPFASFIFG